MAFDNSRKHFIEVIRARVVSGSSSFSMQSARQASVRTMAMPSIVPSRRPRLTPSRTLTASGSPPTSSVSASMWSSSRAPTRSVMSSSVAAANVRSRSPRVWRRFFTWFTRLRLSAATGWLLFAPFKRQKYPRRRGVDSRWQASEMSHSVASALLESSSGAPYPFRICADVFNFSTSIGPAVEANLEVRHVGVTDVVQHRCGKC